MPSLSQLHPIVVHFVIGLLFIGVLLRLASFIGPLRFAGTAATLLLVLGGGATILATQSGSAAHRRAEEIPGVRQAVEDHQEWGEWARNIFLGVAVLELAALAIARPRAKRVLLLVSGVAGVAGAIVLYVAGDRGGDLVYAYAAGVGIRSGDPVDVDRLLTAGLYQQAMVDRGAGKHADAAALIRQLSARHPGDTAVQLVAIESQIQDEANGAAALAALRGFPAHPNSRSLRLTVGVLRVQAFDAVGMPDSARIVLQQLSREFPDRMIRARLPTHF